MKIALLTVVALLYLSLGFAPARRGLRPRVRSLGLLTLLYGFIVYCAFFAGFTKVPLRDSGLILVYLLAPLLLRWLSALLSHEQKHPLLYAILDIACILALWFPLEFQLLPDWRVNELPVLLLLGVLHLVLVYAVMFPIQGMGFNYRLTPFNMGLALGSLSMLVLVAAPIGIWLDFLEPGWHDPSFKKIATSFAVGYFFVALPEEILFRGIIQNRLQQWFPESERLTLFAAALIFGFAHLNNESLNHQPPNWPYVLLATTAGLSYGYVWRKTGSLAASALTHALLNLVWQFGFRGGIVE